HDYDQFMGNIFLKMYDVPDLETVIQNYQKKMDDWHQNDKSLLIDYPFLFNKTDLQIKNSFKNDLIINLIEIILESYDGNIENYFSKKPDILLDKPFFAPAKFSVPFKESLDSYVADLVNFDKDETTFQMLVSHDPNEAPNTAKLRVFDPKDNQILMTLISHINLDFYESKQIILEVGTIAKSINSRPNKRLYDDVKLRLHNMARTGFQLYKKDNPSEPLYTFTFFDNVRTISRDGKEYIAVTFGNTLYESITKKKMTSVTSSNYNSLELQLSRLLYHNLQKERISLSTSSVPDGHGYLYKTYDYSYFQRIILFKKKKKADNIQLITESLHEFAQKKIALADFRYDKGQGLFHLYYFTLSDDERADLVSPRENSKTGSIQATLDLS
ncbi:MAG: RepB family plasmid replication initiator protein, partial [Butyrivibrio sp.]|nr:RepB family plasmid replication initiator protein [Butyrivibrio sp.]